MYYGIICTIKRFIYHKNNVHKTTTFNYLSNELTFTFQFLL